MRVTNECGLDATLVQDLRVGSRGVCDTCKQIVVFVTEHCCEWFPDTFIILFTSVNSCSVKFVKVQPSIVFRVDQIKFGCSERVLGAGLRGAKS